MSKPSWKQTTKKIMFGILIFVKWAFIAGIVGCFLVGGVVVGYTAALVKDEPVRDGQTIESKIEDNAITGYVYFRDNSTLVGQLRTEEDRQLVERKDLPDTLVNAFLATEDNDFYHHPGVNFKSLTRAVKERVLNEDVQTGASTITQQLARRSFLSLDRTDARKLKEIFLSLRIERFLSKDQILVAYLNKIPFGNGSNGYNLFGVKAAARGIFGIDDLNKLNVAQAAYIAGLPQAPSEYSAFNGKGLFDAKGFAAATERQHLVLERMLKEHKITHAQYDEALKFDLKGSLAKTKPKAYTTYPYLMLESERKAAEILLKIEYPKLTVEDLQDPKNADLIKQAHEHLLRNGYKVYTTIDKKVYDALQVIAKDKNNFTPDSKSKGVEQIGGIVLDNKTGAILAMMEGRDFYIEQMNHATQMLRQPGSSMKPIAAFIPALEKGIIQPGGVINDIPLILEDGEKGFHLPANWDNKYHGLITARLALNQSYNIPAIKLFLDPRIGIKGAWDYAKKMGITSLTESDNTAKTGVIGGLEYGVSVEELANAYSTIANHGTFNDAFMISKITDAEGHIVYQHELSPESVFSPETAYLMTDMMRTVVTAGTGKTVKSSFQHFGQIPIVGKTGSTQNDFDAWFMGYSPDITVGVWAGYDTPSTLTLGKGTLRAQKIWSKIMDKSIDLHPDWFKTKKFERPANIVEMTVSNLSGKLPSDLTRQTNHLVTDLFNKKFIPTQMDDALQKMKVIRFKGVNYVPHPSTPADFTIEKTVVVQPEPITPILKRIADMLPKLSQPPLRKNGSPKTVQDFYPTGIQDAAPTEMDPRQDDGAVPSAPGQLAASGSKLTFKPSPNKDVIGYRLYYSDGLGTYQRSGKVVYAGEETAFAITASSGISFYVTAVDVAGKESAPSAVIAANGAAGGSAVIPLGGGGEAGSGTGQLPSSPTNVSVAPGDGGVGVEINWAGNPSGESISKYNVYYSNQQTGTYQLIGSSNTTRFPYVIVPSEGWYRVTAVNSSGESQPSAAVQYK